MNEDRWAQEREWENERGELEVNITRKAKPDEMCAAPRCTKRASTVYEIKLVAHSYSGIDIPLCFDHISDEIAFEIYRTYGEGD